MNKISGILIAFFLLLQPSFGVSAQQQKYFSLKCENEPVIKVIEKIEKESGYWFVYSHNLVDERGTVNVDVKDVTLSQLLNAVFDGTPIQWKIEKKQIVLSRRGDKSVTPSNNTGGVKLR